jgi:DNA repair protein RecO (recombination protein O)
MADWRGQAIVIGARRFGENDAVADVFSDTRGRMSGLVYGGTSRKKKSALEPGSIIDAQWRARSDGALGHFETLEPVGLGPGFLMDDAGALLAVASLTGLLRDAIVEHQAYPTLFEATTLMLAALEQKAAWPAAYVRWELGLLAETGYGLDLSVCALTGTTEELAWVSPKTGRAASLDAGMPYADKLLVLPPFLADSKNAVEPGDVADGLALAGWFLNRELLEPFQKELPEARYRLINTLARDGRI